MHIKRNNGGMAALALAAIGIGVLVAAATDWASPPPTGSARLVSVQRFPEGQTCTWENSLAPQDNVSTRLKPSGAASALMASLRPQNLVAAIEQQSAASSTTAGPRANGTRARWLQMASDSM
jgi:hypothetical protein